MKCPRCDERLLVVLNEPMGQSLECQCGVKIEIPYGDTVLANKVDGLEEGSD